MPNRIQRYTISATTMIATSNGAGKIEYQVTTAPPDVTPDSHGIWCKHEDHLEDLVAQGDELAMLRLQLVERENENEDLRNELRRLGQTIDDLTREWNDAG